MYYLYRVDYDLNEETGEEENFVAIPFLVEYETFMLLFDDFNKIKDYLALGEYRVVVYEEEDEYIEELYSFIVKQDKIEAYDISFDSQEEIDCDDCVRPVVWMN